MSTYPANLDIMRIARLEGRAMREYEMGIHYGNSAHLGNSIKHLEDSYKALHSKTSNIVDSISRMRNRGGAGDPSDTIAKLRQQVLRQRRSFVRSPTRSRSRSTTDSSDSDGYGTPRR